MKLVNFALFTIAMLTCGCLSTKASAGKCTAYLHSLAGEDAISKAERIASSGNPYLLGIQGFSLSFPGVDDPQAPQRVGYKIMEGTTDAIEDDSCWTYQRQARRFAERFNRRVLDLLRRDPVAVRTEPEL
jgi:hypothetical protein